MAFELPTNYTVGNETQSVEGLGSLFKYVDVVTKDAFGMGITILIWFIVFGVGALMNMGRAFASASFVALVFSVYFVRIDMLGPTIPFILAVMTVVGFFWAKSERSPSY